MRLLFIADGRSPIAINWIRYWIKRGDEVHLVSTFPCRTLQDFASLHIVPVAFSSAKRAEVTTTTRSLLWGAATLRLRQKIRHWAGPLTIPKAARRLQKIIHEIQPDLVHALRIPYEGMLAANVAGPSAPLLVSVWGNDFTLHAPSTPLMRYQTEWTVKTADALHADCQRDIRLAHKWGLPTDRPTIVLPGNGGINTDLFHPPTGQEAEPLIINPRGFRDYVRNDTFFQAIPLVLAKHPQARFVCPNMAGEPLALNWIKEMNIGHAVELLPLQTSEQLAEWYHRAQILVSPSTHDGTPNTLLEGMACGCFPIAGDIESIREWITPAKNGLLINPTDPLALADAISEALNDNSLRKQAVSQNTKIIASRAEYQQCMALAEAFYNQIIKG